MCETDGLEDTAVWGNHGDENDMFLSSQWRAKDDAMAFFLSEEFSETVSRGRDVLADQPRYVFLG